jgi:SAM-dependent methyltransferase
MGIIGGSLGYHILRSICKDGRYTGFMDGSAYEHQSKVETLLGPSIWDAIRDKTVIDFGCGPGAEAVEMAKRGARRVIGIDIADRHIGRAVELARKEKVTDRCTFVKHTHERADVIVALDSFEHFKDPAAILRVMRNLLKDEGSVLVSFGPTWYHPLGGHIFSPFPWAHLLFTEKALIRWRSDFIRDGATRFSDKGVWLNRMTIRRFERIIEESPFRFAEFEARPIRRLRKLANRFTREATTSIVRCKLVPRPEVWTHL